jgi:Concanavalin A-like lectin/glucanases superfamily
MSLVVLLPVILLGIVGMLCFVGCVLHTHGLSEPFTSYTKTMRANSDCIAYWPLKDGSDAVAASELISDNKGRYIDQNTAMPGTVYPWPEYSVPNGANPDALSAAAGMGDIQFAQPTIVAGDIDPLPGDPALPACMVVNGCYVEVDWNDKFIPKTTFTVEAWVRVDWTANDPHAWRFVLDMREYSPVTTGFAIYAKADDNTPGMYLWAAIVGDGSSSFVFLDNTELPITLKDPAASAGTVFYLALTYDGQNLTLFVNGEQAGQTASGYAPNAAQVLWIGAGTPYSPRRTQPAGPDPASPLFPFVGAIQDVAIYKIALDAATVATHFNNGNGHDP